MLDENMVRTLLREMRWNLEVGWREPDGPLVVTEPDPAERARTREELVVTVVNLEMVLQEDVAELRRRRAAAAGSGPCVVCSAVTSAFCVTCTQNTVGRVYCCAGCAPQHAEHMPRGWRLVEMVGVSSSVHVFAGEVGPLRPDLEVLRADPESGNILVFEPGSGFDLEAGRRLVLEGPGRVLALEKPIG